MTSCLCLNKAYMPINIYVSPRKAIAKVMNNRAEVIATYPDRIIRTWKDAMEAPAIIRLLYFLNPPAKAVRTMPYSRKNIWLRDAGKCQYCGKFVSLDDMTLEHIIPRDQGGHSTWTNVCCSCLDCNLFKANRTPAQAGMKLRRQPFVPRYTMSKTQETLMRIKSLKNLPHKEWARYVYFDIPLDQD